ncbi:unnamed protein product [Moneuplotes crassus]|uniref:Uncharacterized protein n=1 Tax=Euplotes crassus TaxID=5936 RepID=A0AAD1XJ22_EUPCR|nr:unnamed protein product [Moneuplotes crassus]
MNKSSGNQSSKPLKRSWRLESSSIHSPSCLCYVFNLIDGSSFNFCKISQILNKSIDQEKDLKDYGVESSSQDQQHSASQEPQVDMSNDSYLQDSNDEQKHQSENPIESGSSVKNTLMPIFDKQDIVSCHDAFLGNKFSDSELKQEIKKLKSQIKIIIDEIYEMVDKELAIEEQSKKPLSEDNELVCEREELVRFLRQIETTLRAHTKHFKRRQKLRSGREEQGKEKEHSEFCVEKDDVESLKEEIAKLREDQQSTKEQLQRTQEAL